MGERRVRGALLALVATAGALAACGSDDDEGTTLERADAALQTVDRAHITLTVTATAGTGETATAPVGFRVDGAYDMEAGSTYPVFDVTYDRLLGAQTETVQVQSDGARVVVQADGSATEVPPEQAVSLRKSDDREAGALEGLGIASWVAQPVESEGPATDGVATTLVTGSVNAADLLSDVTAVLQQLTGETDVVPLDGESAERVAGLVRASSIEVLVGEDDVPRRLTAQISFGRDVPAEVATELGPLAGAALAIELVLVAPGEPVPPPSLPV